MKRRRRPCAHIDSLATHAPVFVTLPSLSAYWHVEYQTIRKWIRAGSLPAYRFGQAWRVRTSDALEFEQRGMFKASA